MRVVAERDALQKQLVDKKLQSTVELLSVIRERDNLRTKTGGDKAKRQTTSDDTKLRYKSTKKVRDPLRQISASRAT